MEEHPSWFDTSWVRGFAQSRSRLDMAETDGLFLVPLGWDTDWCCLAEWLVYHVDHGQARLRVRRDRETELAPGDLICVPPKRDFRVQALHPRSPVRIRRFRFTRADPSPDPVLIVRDCPQVSPVLDELIEEAGQADEPLHGERVTGLLQAFFIVLLRQLHKDRRRKLSVMQERQARAWTAFHAADPVDPAALAGHLGLSHDYCTRLFRGSFGCPPRSWLLQQRLNQVAMQLRETDRPLDDLAQAFGYRDQKLLGRQFQRRFGISPGRYRRRFRGL